MRVMLVNDFYDPYMVGGTETLVCQLALGLRDRKHEVVVVTARIGQLSTKEIIQGITVFRIGSFPEIKHARRIASGTAPGRLTSEIRADFESITAWFRPEVIHFYNVWLLGPEIISLARCRKGATLNDYWPICVRRALLRVNWRPCPGPAPVACRLCRLRAPATWRSFDLINIEKERSNQKALLASCDFVTAPTQFVADQISHAIQIDPLIVHYGIAVDIHVAREEHSTPPFGILFASHPTKMKGYQVVLNAFARRELQAYTLSVAGDAPVSSSPNVKVLGRQRPEVMPSLIARADCVVVPSIWPEPAGIIILESLRAGVPVVASRIGGIPELMQDEVTGLLVPPGDVAALAAAIRRCCEDEGLRASARRLGPAVVKEHFSLAGMILRLEELYAS